MVLEKIFTSIYQDVYRLSPGVLILVNKFETYGSLADFDMRPYAKSEYLKEITEDQVDRYSNRKYPAGTVFYEGRAVRLVGCAHWVYEIRISGGCCYGTSDQIREFADNLVKITNEPNENTISENWLGDHSKEDDDFYREENKRKWQYQKKKKARKRKE